MTRGEDPPASEPAPRQSATEPTGRYAAFRYRPFTLYWVGLVVSYVGVRATLAANLWLLYELTNSAVLVGAVGIADAAAILLLTPVGGVLADRFERRRVLQASQLLAAVVSAIMWADTGLGLVEPWHIYLAVALGSAAVTFDLPVRQALVPSLVPPSAVVSALTLSTPVLHVAGLVGPALGGLLIAATGGVAGVYLFDALAHLFLVATLLLLGVSAGRQQARSGAGLLRSFGEGIRFVGQRPVLWQLMLLDFATVLFGAYRALLPVIARDSLAAGPSGYGFLTSAISAGALLGGAAIIQLGTAASFGRLVLLATAGYAVVVIALGQVQSFPLALLATGALGFLDAMGMTVRNTLVQLETPDELRGRVAAVGSMLARSGPAIGQTLIGALATALGVPIALALGGGVPLLLSGCLASFTRTLREYHGRAGPPAG